MAYSFTTLTAPAYDSTTAKFGQALSGGIGNTGTAVLTPGNFPTALTMTCWLKNSDATSPQIALGSSAPGNFWLGLLNGTVDLTVNLPSNATLFSLNPSTVITNGAWHHIAFVWGASGATLFVDGVSVATNAAAFPGPGFTPALFGVRNWPASEGPFNAGFAWRGEVDDIALFNTALYTANFTPPTAPVLDSAPNLVAHWALDGNGLDTAIAPAVSIAPNNPGIVYSPYNWSAPTAAVARTWNPGAYFRTFFSGTACTLTFDVTHNTTPLSQVWYRIDNGPWSSANVAASVACTIPPLLSGNIDTPYHRLDVVFKGMDSNAARNCWVDPDDTSVRFTGLALSAGAAVIAPGRAPVNVLIYGDSITEGVRTLGEAGSGFDPANNDAMLSWSFELGRLLGAEVGIVGFGGTGYTVAYRSVPALPAAYALVAAGVARAFTPSPDLIIINHGHNDGSTSVVSAATTVVNALLAACPAAKIVLLNPLTRADMADLVAVQAGCAVPARVKHVSTAGFMNVALGADSLNVHPSGPNGVAVIAPKVAAAVRGMLPQVPRWSHS